MTESSNCLDQIRSIVQMTIKLCARNFGRVSTGYFLSDLFILWLVKRRSDTKKQKHLICLVKYDVELFVRPKYLLSFAEREGKFNANLQIEKQEKEAMLDWNVKDVVDGEVLDSGKEKDIIKNNIQNAPESNV